MAHTRIRGTTASQLPPRLRPRKSPRQRRAKELVAAVLEAGSRILIARGYEQLSMKEVAKVAGVSPGSLYQYFPDKPALVAALVEAQSQRELAFHTERFAELAPGADLFGALEHLVRSVLDFQREEGPLMRALLTAMPWLGRYPTLTARVKDASGLVHALLEQHRAQVAIEELSLATHVLTNAIHSLTHDGALPRPASLDDDALLREVMRLVRGYLTTSA